MSNKIIIKIEDIENAPNKELQINFEDFIEDIKTKEPIKANLKAIALGDFIKIYGQVQGAATLQCDLCLDEFEYKFDFELEELFAKNALMEEYPEETELKEGQFVTDLKGSCEIDVSDLLYQSVILDFPNKKVCGITCKGNDFLSEENFLQEGSDPRLAIFRNIEVNRKN